MKISRTQHLIASALVYMLAITPTVVQASDALPSWNGGAVKNSIVEFVAQVTKDGGLDFVPPAERVAVFDNDGTLWSEHPVYVQLLFALDRVKALAPHHPEWKTNEPFASLLKDDVKGALAGGERAMVEIVMATHAGMTTEEFESIVKDWIVTAKHPRFKRPYTEVVYQPMLELLTYLRANGFKTFIVSSGGIEFMRPWVEAVCGVPPEQVVGSSIKTKFELRNDTPVLVRLPELNFIDDKAGKPVGIHQYIGRRPIAAFGNSDGDFEMLEWTTAGPGHRLGLYVHHDDNTREFAYDRTSSIGRLDRGLNEAPSRGWVVASIKRDWKRVFAFDETDGVTHASANDLTGIKWRVAELSGHPVTTLLHQAEQPFMMFDAAKQQVVGYAGCNRFFGGYSLEGAALKFGPIGATKRACPDLEEAIETEFFKALHATQSWRIVEGDLQFLNNGRVLIRFQKIQGP